MPKYHIHVDTDKGEFFVKKDGEDLKHHHMCIGSYMCASEMAGPMSDNYSTDQNVSDDYNAMVSQAKTKQHVYISHAHTNDKGVKETYDYAFYLGQPEQPNTMLSPNYGVPSASISVSEEASKTVEKNIAIAKLNELFSKNK